MVPMPKRRSSPNILVTGTPGVGKSSLCSTISAETGLRWIDVSNLAVERQFVENYDEKYKCSIIDEDKLLDSMEEVMSEGGNIVDYHGSEFFPERWFDIVFVLRTNNTTLYDRLVSRGYSGKKLEDNISCEIFGTLLEEAVRSYAPEIVVQLVNDSDQDMEDNATCIIGWINSWRQNRNDT